MEYFIVKIDNDRIIIWNPRRTGFYEQMVSPYFSLELAERVYNRITLPNGKYLQDSIKIMKTEVFYAIRENYQKWTQNHNNWRSIRGANYDSSGEIRGANYNNKGHTNVGNVGWMKYNPKWY